MNILVTGGNGYIGSRLVERLVQERHRLTVIDFRPNPNGAELYKGCRFICVNAADKKCDRLFADTRYDAVIHLACNTLPSNAAPAYSQINENNLAALANILYLSAQFLVPKVIVLFDYRIYGHKFGRMKNEKNKLEPDCDTGFQEQIRESYCESYRRQGLHVVSVRTGVIYGPSLSDNPDVFALRCRIQAHEDDARQSEPKPDAQIIDCLYINDLVEAFIRILENNTSPVLNISSGKPTTLAQFKDLSRKAWSSCEAESGSKTKDSTPKLSPSGQRTDHSHMIDLKILSASSGCYLDCKQAVFELDWLPKYSLEDGIHRAILNLIRQEDHVYQVEHIKKTKTKHKNLAFLTNADFENLVIFAITSILAFWVNYRLGIELDLLLLYVVLINIFFGLQQGGIAIGLAILVRLWFSFGEEDIGLIDYFTNANSMLILVFYFIIGTSIGVIKDRAEQGKIETQTEVEQAKVDLDYTVGLYQSTLEVNRNLQAIISSTEDSFSKIGLICSDLDQIDADIIFDRAVWDLSEVLKTTQVQIYLSSSNNGYLRLAATTQLTYPKSIRLSDNEYLNEAIQKQKIVINKAMNPDFPMVIAPIRMSDASAAFIFLDGIEFMRLNQHYLNTLKSLTELISLFIRKANEYDTAVNNSRYVMNFVVEQGWFSQLIEAKRNSTQVDELHNGLFRIKLDDSIVNSLCRDLLPVVRTTDRIGILDQENIGVLISNLDQADIKQICNRLHQNGYNVDWMEIR